MTDLTIDYLDVTSRIARRYLEDVRYYYKPYVGHYYEPYERMGIEPYERMGIGLPPGEVEITEEGDELIVSKDVPRLVKESISARIVEDVLYINADRKVRRRDKPGEELVKFYQRIPLPYKFEDVKATATYAEGTLRVRIPLKGTGTVKLE